MPEQVLLAEELHERARTIAALVADTHTDQRNVLYDKIAEELRNRSQSYTANLYHLIAGRDRSGV